MDQLEFDAFIKESVAHLEARWRAIRGSQLTPDECEELADTLDTFFSDVVTDEEEGT